MSRSPSHSCLPKDYSKKRLIRSQQAYSFLDGCPVLPQCRRNGALPWPSTQKFLSKLLHAACPHKT
eukprot:3240468-Amphidinium_carterae.3